VHAIGVILFRYGQEDAFSVFLTDVLPHTTVLSLPLDQYDEVVTAKKRLALDFDDAYQYRVAKSYNLTIVKMDRDFERVPDVSVSFL
jgi:predicted nucleic acid-binding protein